MMTESFKKIGLIITVEIFLFNSIGLSVEILPGYVPFQSQEEVMPPTGGDTSTLSDFYLPPLMVVDPGEVQHQSYTLDTGERYYPTFVTQPESAMELIKIIEPSFLPQVDWLTSIMPSNDSQETANWANESNLIELLELGRMWFTMNKNLIPFYFYQLRNEGMDVTAVSGWKYEGDSLSSLLLPDLLRDELKENGVLGAGYNVVVLSRDFKIRDSRTGEEQNVTQKRIMIDKGNIQTEIIEFDLEDGKNIYLAITKDDAQGTISSSIIYGNWLYSTPLYSFVRSGFQLAEGTAVEVGKESGYNLCIYERNEEGRTTEIGELNIDKVVVFGRQESSGEITKFQYRVKSNDTVYLEGKEIPIAGVVEYRDVILDPEFSIPISYRMASYTPGDIGLHTAEYYRMLSPGEEVYCTFPVDGIRVKDDEPAKLIYVRHCGGWDIVITSDVSYSEIQNLSPEELKSLLISEGSEITIQKEMVTYTIKNNGSSFNVSKGYYEDVTLDDDGDLQSYTYKKIYYSLSSLTPEFFQAIFGRDIDSWIKSLEESKLIPEAMEKYYEERKEISSSEGSKETDETSYLIDFHTGETTVKKKHTVWEEQRDEVSALLGYLPEEIESMVLKYKKIPPSSEESYDFDSLAPSDLIWVQKSRIGSDELIGNVFDYREGQNTVTIYYQNRGKLSYKKYSGEIVPKSNAVSEALLEPDSIDSIPDSVGVAKYDQDANTFNKIWELRKEDSTYGYYILPVESLQGSAYHLYKLLQYTGQLDAFLDGETVEINLVKDLNEMAEKIDAGKDKANSFISSLNNYWAQYRRMLLLEISSVGAEIIDDYDGSEDCNYVIKLQLPQENFNTPIKRKDVNIDISGNTITIIENHPQLGTVSRRVELILENAPGLLSQDEKFDFLCNFYLCESESEFDNLSKYLHGYQVKEINIYDSTGARRIRLTYKDGNLHRIEYPNEYPQIASYLESGTDPQLVYQDREVVIPEKEHWEGETAATIINSKLRGFDKVLDRFLDKYGSNMEAAVREGKIDRNYVVTLWLNEEPPVWIQIYTPQDILIAYNGYNFLFQVEKTSDDIYKVSVSFYGPNDKFESEPWEINRYVLDSCYPFLTKGLNGEELTLDMIKEILVSLRDKLRVGIPVHEGEYLEYPSDGDFRLNSSADQSVTSMVEEKFFEKVRDFLYYYALAKVCDQISKGENEWITLPSGGNLTDILASYPLVGFEWLNDLIISATGGDESGGHTAFSVDASKLYFAHSIVMYDKDSGLGYLTHQYYNKTEFEFGEDKEAFQSWVISMLGDDKVTEEDIDNLWGVYQLAKTERNIGIFYYYCRGAFAGGDEAELNKLKVASESEKALEPVYNIMSKEESQVVSEFGKGYKEYFKYLTLPDYGDKWAPLERQIVLEPSRVNITWETIGAITATIAVYLIDRSGVLGTLLSRLDALKEYGKVAGWLGKILGWGVQTAVGSVRGASVFSMIYGLPMLIGQTGEVDLIQWLNSLGENFFTSLIYSALFGILFTPAQFGIGDMPPLIGLIGKPVEKLLKYGAGRIGNVYPRLAKVFNGTATGIKGFLEYGNRIEAAVIGRDAAGGVRASLTNWRYIAWYYPTEVIAEEMVIPQALAYINRNAPRGLLFHEAPMVRTFRALAIGTLRNTETAGSIAEMTDPLENPLGFLLLPGIISVVKQYGIGDVLGLRVPTD